MNWSHTYGAKIASEDFKVILCDEKSQEVYFHGQKKEKPCFLISIMSTSKLWCQKCFRDWGYANNTQNTRYPSNL